MPSGFLTASAHTWESDSHGLFDYESKAVFKKSFRAPQNGTDYKLVRNGNDVSMLPDSTPNPESGRTLARLFHDKGTYKIGSGVNMESDRLWMVLKSLKTASPLGVGDLIKLGRFRLRVKEIVTNQQQHQEAITTQRPANPSVINGDDETETIAPDTADEHEASDNESIDGCVCRVCLSEGSEPGNPLVSTCLCKGSMKYVHLQCLRRWMQGRLNIRSDTNQSSFFWRELDCELCKTPYPIMVEAFGKQVVLFEVPRPEWPYIILETVMRPAENPMRGLHILSLANKKSMKLGRGHESDIRITDISVSRCHARIEFVKNEFVIKDDDSKFGTLVGWKNPYRLQHGTGAAFQVGRTVVQVQARRSFSLFPACVSKAAHNTDIITTQVSCPDEMSKRRPRSSVRSRNDLSESGRDAEAAVSAQIDSSDPRVRAANLPSSSPDEASNNGAVAGTSCHSIPAGMETESRMPSGVLFSIPSRASPQAVRATGDRVDFAFSNTRPLTAASSSGRITFTNQESSESPVMANS